MAGGWQALGPSLNTQPSYSSGQELMSPQAGAGDRPGAENYVGILTGQGQSCPSSARMGSREPKHRKQWCNFGGNSQSQSH